MAIDPSKVVVVGAGVAGLTLAAHLAEGGYEVVVLERDVKVGGLARSFQYGEFTFDIGPHRFHTYDTRVDAFVEEILGGNSLEIGRRSGVWMFDHYFDWPLGISALPRLPPRLLVAAGVDLLRSRSRSAEGDSLRDYVRSRYGDRVYETFFRPYTERFVRTRCEDLSADWAKTGIERAVIDRRVKADSLLQLARSMFDRPSPLTFRYPSDGGIGAFADRLSDVAMRAGAKVVTSSDVIGLEVDGGHVQRVRAGANDFECGVLVWTGSINEIGRLLGLRIPELRYLSLLLFNCLVAGEPASPYQWCYYSAPEVAFSRVSTPKRFNPSLAPPGRHGLCVELTALRDDDAWQSPQSLAGQMIEGLEEVGLIRETAQVRGIEIERIRNAYPIYTLGYRESVAAARERIEALQNVHLLGRSGTFWYNNMDHSIGAALNLAERLLEERIGPANG